MNTQLIDSIIQVIRSLSPEEQAVLAAKLFFDPTAPSTPDMITLALQGGSFDFLHNEPDSYSLDNGEPVPCL